VEQIYKKENCVSKKFYPKVLGLFGGLFSGDSGIPGRSDSSRKEDPGSPITSRTGSEEIPAQDLRDTEDEMPVGNLSTREQSANYFRKGVKE